MGPANPAQVGTHKAQFIYGGEASVFEMIKSTLEIFGKAVFVGKDPDMVEVLEVGLFMAISPMEVGLLQGRKYCELAALAANANAPVELFDSLVPTYVVNYSEKIIESMQRITDTKSIEGGMRSGATISMMADVSQHILTHIKDFDLDPGMFRAILKLYTNGIASGQGDYDGFCVADLPISEDGSDKK